MQVASESSLRAIASSAATSHFFNSIVGFLHSYRRIRGELDQGACCQRLAMPAEAAADLAWASAHAAAILYVTAQRQAPDPAVIDALRDHAMDAIFKKPEAEKSA